ncbi:hypothetical protein D3C81_2297400 [compost metagenome]
MIKPRNSELPKNISNLLVDKHYTEYIKAHNKISEKQKKKIEDRVKKTVKSQFPD